MIPPDQPTYNLQPVIGPYGISYFVAAPTEDDSALAPPLPPGPEVEPTCACNSLSLTGSGHDAACAWLAWKRRARA